MPIALLAAARSDVGRVRADNQDAGLASARVAAVADGVGGLRGGAVAAAVAVTHLAELAALAERPGPVGPAEAAGSATGVGAPVDGPADAPLEALRERVAAVQVELEAVAARRPSLAGLSTTLTALAVSGDDLLLAHVGDSRCYRLADGRLEQVSRDHTYVQHLVDAGAISAAQAERHPHRHLIVRALGSGSTAHTADAARLPAAAGQRWLLCSDGLSGVVGATALAAVLDSPRDAGACADALVALALRAGAPDNVTAVVVDVVDAADAATADTPAGTTGATVAVELVGSAAVGPRAA